MHESTANAQSGLTISASGDTVGALRFNSATGAATLNIDATPHSVATASVINYGSLTTASSITHNFYGSSGVNFSINSLGIDLGPASTTNTWAIQQANSQTELHFKRYESGAYVDKFYITSAGNAWLYNALYCQGNISCGAAYAMGIGDPGLDGSWRVIISSSNLLFQARLSSVWTTEATVPLGGLATNNAIVTSNSSGLFNTSSFLTYDATGLNILTPGPSTAAHVTATSSNGYGSITLYTDSAGYVGKLTYQGNMGIATLNIDANPLNSFYNSVINYGSLTTAYSITHNFYGIATLTSGATAIWDMRSVNANYTQMTINSTGAAVVSQLCFQAAGTEKWFISSSNTYSAPNNRFYVAYKSGITYPEYFSIYSDGTSAVYNTLTANVTGSATGFLINATTGYAIFKMNQNNAALAYVGFNVQRQGVEKWFFGMDASTDNLIFRRTASSNDVYIDTAGKMFINAASFTTSCTFVCSPVMSLISAFYCSAAAGGTDGDWRIYTVGGKPHLQQRVSGTYVDIAWNL
jgi:hypothetical protein